MLKRSKSSAPVREMLPIPDELKCSMCSELMKDAVIIQCCGESFCDDCKQIKYGFSSHSDCKQVLKSIC